MERYACTLAEIDSGSLALVGGKGANLGELTRAGLPVPLAFCVTTAAYRLALEANSLPASIAVILDQVDYSDPAGIERDAKKIRDMIMLAAIPADVEAAIRAGYAGLESKLGKEVLVSVRSSATAEDLPGMSFAGQQDTYLNIGGVDNVLQHVRKCWASLWTDRAIAYRHKQGFRHEEVFLAVVVQEMFPSEVAGVLFTANPVTSNPEELFLNASWELGEAVVSGKVNPDQYIVDKKTFAIKDKQINEKTLMTVRRDGGQGSEEAEVPDNLRLAKSLSPEQIKQLSEIALRIEKHYGFPQDIEWGYAKGRFAVLQAREVTAADIDFGAELEAWQTPEALASLTSDRWVWSRAYSDEVQTGPSTPLFYTEIQSRTTMKKINVMNFTGATECLGYPRGKFRDIPYFRWYGARAYYNTEWEIERIRRFIPPFARDDAALWPFPAEDREKIRNMPFNWSAFIWLIARLHVTSPKFSLLGSTRHAYKNFEKWTAYEASLWAALDLEKASTKEILATREKAVANSGFRASIVLPFTIYLYVLPATLQKILERWCDDQNMRAYNSLIAGLHTKTSEESLAIWALSRRIKQSPTLMALFQMNDVSAIFRSLDDSGDGRAFKVDLDAFLKRYGHRGAAERDLVYPRWRHQPENVFNSIRPMLPLGDEDDPNILESRLHERMLKAKEDAVAKARRSGFGFLKAPLLRWFINLTQDYIYYRDFERFCNDKTMAVPRDMYMAIGRKFVKRGLMPKVEDIFFLGREEIVAAEEGRLCIRDITARIRARRRMYEKYARKEPPKYVRSWETFEDDTPPDDGMGLRGIAASSGTVTGRARVCRKLEEISRIQKGDIVVTVATDPAWTTVFSIIGGVVVETGGVVAHAVMISREYGIPCVANLTHACDLIPDGAMITVDGSRGRVLIHDIA